MEQAFEMKLQLFGEGGDSGGAGDGGASQTDGAGEPSGQQARLKALGVPEYVLARRAKHQGQAQGGEPAPDLAAEPATSVVQEAAVETAPTENVLREDVRSHFDDIHRQAGEMGRKYPGFDLQKELQNPTFFHLTSPRVGLSVEDAYMAVHHREVVQAITRGAKQEFANAVRAGGNRPSEHGIGAKAPAMVTFDYKNASRNEREAFKKRIYDAAARGEKIYPGT